METHVSERELLEAAAKDDGAALRLAVTLGLQVITSGAKVMQAVHYESGAYGECERGDDPCAATRRAIVNAATERTASPDR